MLSLGGTCAPLVPRKSPGRVPPTDLFTGLGQPPNPAISCLIKKRSVNPLAGPLPLGERRCPWPRVAFPGRYANTVRPGFFL